MGSMTVICIGGPKHGELYTISDWPDGGRRDSFEVHKFEGESRAVGEAMPTRETFTRFRYEVHDVVERDGSISYYAAPVGITQQQLKSLLRMNQIEIAEAKRRKNATFAATFGAAAKAMAKFSKAVQRLGEML